MEKLRAPLDQYELHNYLTLPGERLLVSKREHWYAAMIPAVFTTLFSVVSLTTLLFICTVFVHSILLFISSGLLATAFFLSIFVKILTDWYYHVYIVTTRRILELTYVPMFYEKIDDVLLDQVRIIEVDVKVRNIIEEVLNFGDVIIAFDRPSHQETFTLCNIENPGKVGAELCDAFEIMMHEMPIWFNRAGQREILKFTEDIT